MLRYKPKKGERYGRLAIVRELPRRITKSGGKRVVLCECDCGNKKVVQIGNLRNGHSKSCGCQKNEAMGKRFTTHGKTGTAEHIAWNLMRNRCSNENYILYHRYGGRGITVCSRWKGKDGFQNFLDDMGEKPAGNYSLDRVNNNGNYEPKNCRWATPKQQANNRGKNIFVSVNGVRIFFSELAEMFNINVETLRERIFDRKWDLKRAFLQNPNEYHNKVK